MGCEWSTPIPPRPLKAILGYLSGGRPALQGCMASTSASATTSMSGAGLRPPCQFAAPSGSEFSALNRLPASLRPGVLLDRDGTIIVDHGYVGSVDRVDFIDGAPEAIASFNRLNIPVAVLTNQAGVARGTSTRSRTSRGCTATSPSG